MLITVYVSFIYISDGPPAAVPTLVAAGVANPGDIFWEVPASSQEALCQASGHMDG